MTPLPTHNDINVFDSLDERDACKHFLGKSLEEVEQLFRESSLRRLEDLGFMGPVAFRFYLTAFIRYIQSDFATGDDSVDYFGSILEILLEYEAEELIPVANQIAASCNYIAEHVERFGCNALLCGQFTALKERFVRLDSG